MKTIPLTQGQVALVDDEDYEFLNQFVWFAYHSADDKRWYAAGHINGKQIKMHRLIVNPNPKEEIDHKDGNGLNNQRSNLRKATRSQNQANRGAQDNNTSGYKGVRWHRRAQKYEARIAYQGTLSNLGLFNDSIEAAKAYDRASKRLFGEFAGVNFT